MNKLLKKLLDHLFPGIDGEENDSSDIDDTSASDVDDDFDIDLPDDSDADDLPVRAEAPRESNAQRLARLEAEVERRGRARDDADRAPVTPRVDPDFQREEERLRAADITELERWQIQSNRTIRQSQASAQQALAEAQDLRDRTKFEAGSRDDPRRAKYADRVEKAVEQERGAGRNVSRESVYFYMLGKDIAEGKLKAGKAKPSAPAVARGKPANVRSDVQGRGRASSEQDKRRSRLANMNI